MSKAKAGQWIVAGDTLSDLDFGHVHEDDDGALMVSWYSSHQITRAPLMEGGMWPDDVRVFDGQRGAAAAYEARCAELGGVA